MAKPKQAHALRLHFDARQVHQIEAVEAVADLFSGQAFGQWGASRPQALTITEERMLENLCWIRARHGLESPEGLDGFEASVEMETGTGKTYVYLRTIRELHRRYGFDRFVVVTPSVAIREGLVQQAEHMSAHFDELYPEANLETRVYRPGKDALVRSFVGDPGIQVLVLNIDAFNKRKANLIHRPTDSLWGHPAIELIAGRRPIVILDEPQNMEGPKAQEAIASLSPLMTLRYSATHRRLRNLVYRLDPVRAYDLGLVKRLEVSSVVSESEGPPPIEVKDIRATTRGVSARVFLEVKGDSGPSRKLVKLSAVGDDLEALSQRSIYKGWKLASIDVAGEEVHFSNGVSLRVGSEHAPEARTQIMREQIYETLQQHFETELRIQTLQEPNERMKVLSLVFVDRVVSYVGEGGTPGFVQRFFDEAYVKLAGRARYASLKLPPANMARAAYFSERRGEAVDTTGKSRDDDRAYALIMQDKTRLLSMSEPVRFIFSHSALREGWDNPNVFQICTLHRTRSELRKRQEIGRGLRLPVMANGRRCKDPDLARLTLIANESYESFARTLQAEIKEECAVDFGARVVNAKQRGTQVLRAGWRERPAFLATWAQIGRPVEMQLRPPSQALREACVSALKALDGGGGFEVVTRRARIELREGGVQASALRSGRRSTSESVSAQGIGLTNPLESLQAETALTRKTLVHALLESGRLEQLWRDPVGFLESASLALQSAIRRVSAEHVSYRVLSEEPVSLRTFETRDAPRLGPHSLSLSCSIYEALSAGRASEAAWLASLEDDTELTHLMRWPSWHRVASPLGPLDLGWVVARGGHVTCVLDARLYQGHAIKACAQALCEALGLEATYQLFD